MALSPVYFWAGQVVAWLMVMRLHITSAIRQLQQACLLQQSSQNRHLHHHVSHVFAVCSA